MSQQKIIAFSARKQGGKTTATNYLRRVFTKHSRSVETVNFADSLKYFVVREFCPTQDCGDSFSFDIEHNKNMMLSCGKTVREILQIVGTDWFRSLDPEYWIKKWKAAVLHSRAEIILCGDVRFPNEVQAVQSLGGKVVRLIRSPFPDDRHASETALDVVQKTGKVFNAIMDNSDMSILEQNLETAIWVQRWYPELAEVFQGE